MIFNCGVHFCTSVILLRCPKRFARLPQVHHVQSQLPCLHSRLQATHKKTSPLVKLVLAWKNLSHHSDCLNLHLLSNYCWHQPATFFATKSKGIDSQTHAGAPNFVYGPTCAGRTIHNCIANQHLHMSDAPDSSCVPKNYAPSCSKTQQGIEISTHSFQADDAPKRHSFPK